MRCIKLLILLMLLPSLVWADGVLTPAATPPDAVSYDYRSSVKLQDEFVSGNATSGQIGALGWGFTSGTAALQASAANRPGIMRRATSASSGTLAITYLYTGVTGAWSQTSHDLTWILRLNQVDANTSARWGAMSSYLSNPPNDGVFFERLDGEANYYCVTRASSAQTRTDSGVAADTSFHVFSYTYTSTAVQFYIDRVPVCSVMTTNITASSMNAAVQIINSTAADKTLDLDYFELNLKGLTR